MMLGEAGLQRGLLLDPFITLGCIISTMITSTAPKEKPDFNEVGEKSYMSHISYHVLYIYIYTHIYIYYLL